MAPHSSRTFEPHANFPPSSAHCRPFQPREHLSRGLEVTCLKRKHRRRQHFSSSAGEEDPSLLRCHLANTSQKDMGKLRNVSTLCHWGLGGLSVSGPRDHCSPHAQAPSLLPGGGGWPPAVVLSLILLAVEHGLVQFFCDACL